MKTILFLILVLLTFNKINSQTSGIECGTITPSDKWESEFSNLIKNFSNDFTEYTIPVIFHVIHGGQLPVLSQTLIRDR